MAAVHIRTSCARVRAAFVRVIFLNNSYRQITQCTQKCRIWCILASKSETWWQYFNNLPENQQTKVCILNSTDKSGQKPYKLIGSCTRSVAVSLPSE